MPCGAGFGAGFTTGFGAGFTTGFGAGFTTGLGAGLPWCGGGTTTGRGGGGGGRRFTSQPRPSQTPQVFRQPYHVQL